MVERTLTNSLQLHVKKIDCLIQDSCNPRNFQPGDLLSLKITRQAEKNGCKWRAVTAAIYHNPEPSRGEFCYQKWRHGNSATTKVQISFLLDITRVNNEYQTG